MEGKCKELEELIKKFEDLKNGECELESDRDYVENLRNQAKELVHKNIRVRMSRIDFYYFPEEDNLPF